VAWLLQQKLSARAAFALPEIMCPCKLQVQHQQLLAAAPQLFLHVQNSVGSHI
jgi:hypothetical protein